MGVEAGFGKSVVARDRFECEFVISDGFESGGGDGYSQAGTSFSIPIFTPPRCHVYN